jgi:ACR3 family arsenite efflux pump ArsB
LILFHLGKKRERKWQFYEVIAMLITLMMVIISQCKHVLKHQIACLTYTIPICQLYLNKTGAKNKCSDVPSKTELYCI